jgi:hypothetical protein
MNLSELVEQTSPTRARSQQDRTGGDRINGICLFDQRDCGREQLVVPGRYARSRGPLVRGPPADA